MAKQYHVTYVHAAFQRECGSLSGDTTVEVKRQAEERLQQKGPDWYVYLAPLNDEAKDGLNLMWCKGPTTAGWESYVVTGAGQ